MPRFTVLVAVPNFRVEVEAPQAIHAVRQALDRFAVDRRGQDAILHVVTAVGPEGLAWFRSTNLAGGNVRLTEWSPDDEALSERAFSDEEFARANVPKLLAALRRMHAEYSAMVQRLERLGGGV